MSFLLHTRKLTQPEFDEKLRSVYADALKEPLPRRFLELLARLK